MPERDPGPLLIMADSYREAQLWAAEHGYANVAGRPRGGLIWIYVQDWANVRGRMNGTYVDLRRETVEPLGAWRYLRDHGFIEMNTDGSRP